MTIGNALTFIKTGQKDGDLRRKLVRAKGKGALEKVLARNNLNFSPAEFEEAYSVDYNIISPSFHPKIANYSDC